MTNPSSSKYGKIGAEVRKMIDNGPQMVYEKMIIHIIFGTISTASE